MIIEFDDLTDEQKAKLAACETLAELAQLAQEYGHELTDEELAQVGGGELSTCWH